MKLYGYARVSSHDQNLDRQIYALLEKGIEKKVEKILIEKTIKSFFAFLKKMMF